MPTRARAYACGLDLARKRSAGVNPRGQASGRGLLSRCRVDDGGDLRNGICRKLAESRMLSDEFFRGCYIHAVDLVAGYIAVHPLDLGAELSQYLARRVRDAAQFLRRQLAGSWNFSLDQIFRHNDSSVWLGAATLAPQEGKMSNVVRELSATDKRSRQV